MKGGISIYAGFGPPRYVLWCCGGICHELLTFFQIGCGHTVQKWFIWITIFSAWFGKWHIILSTIGWYQFSFISFITHMNLRSSELNITYLYPFVVYSANSVSSFKIIFNPLCSNTVLHVSIRMTIIWLFLYCTLFKASSILMPWEIDHIELKKWCLLHKQLNKQNTIKWLPFFSCIFNQISLDVW